MFSFFKNPFKRETSPDDKSFRYERLDFPLEENDNPKEKKNDIRLVTQEEENLLARLIEIKAASYSRPSTISILRSSARDVVLLIMCTLVGSGMTVGAGFFANYFDTLSKSIQQAKGQYNHNPQLNLGNLTCAEATDYYPYDCNYLHPLINVFNETITAVCEPLVEKICEHTVVPPFILIIFVVFGPVLLGTLGIFTYREFMKQSKNPFLRLSEEDKHFLSNIFSERMSLEEFRAHIDHCIENVIPLQRVMGPLFADKFRLGSVGNIVYDYLDDADHIDANQFQRAVSFSR